MLIIMLVIGFVLFQAFGTNEGPSRSIAEVEEWLKTLPKGPVDDVHRYDVMGPFE